MGHVANRVSSPRLHLSMPSLSGLFGIAFLRDPQARLQVALLLSLLVHTLVVAFVGIRPPGKLDAASTPLIVDLVNARTEIAPKAPTILAQANLDGGGNTDADRHVRSPLPVLKRPEPQPDVSVRRQRAEPRKQAPQPVLTQAHEPAPAVAMAQPQSRSEVRPEPETPSATDILNASREMLQLEAQVSRSMEAYQKRPRRTFIGARAKEFRFARYIEDWRGKIERVGELNYPAGARGIYGNLLVSVEIRADGSLENVEISRSSGKRVLDEAAVRIVRLAAPFAPFPPDIARDTDILSITRTWSFTLADRFQAE
ncbi:MAG: energy transducer TonB [Burkholderiales bacterium]|nr:energy transducer TonB [Burkholderiales bacterium]